MKEKPILAITMGDPAGIGPEVIARSLASSEVKNICSPILVGSLLTLKRAAELTQSKIHLKSFKTFEKIDFQADTIPVLECVASSLDDIEPGHESEVTGEAAAQAIRKSVELALEEKVNGIVTGPTSKRALHLAGYTYPGQTEFLANLTDTSEVVMLLSSRNLRVALVTTHCSLSDVAARITKEVLVKKMTILHEGLRSYLDVEKPRIAVCALNPHGGESGIFGKEESEIIKPAIEEVMRRGINAVGPVPADTLFARSKKKSHDAYLAMYHDQGLIPLKMDAFGKGVNITLGLPIIRTSPDHGTAFDIVGQGIADPGSMIEAIKLAAHMAERKK